MPTNYFQPQPRKGMNGWGIAGIVLGCGFGLFSVTMCTATVASSVQEDPSQPNPTVTVTAPASPNPTVTVTAEPKDSQVPETEEPKATTEADPGDSNTLVEGMNEIGVDAPDGQYKVIVPDDGGGCYWERAKDDKGGFDSIIANEYLQGGSRGSVTVKDGEFFKSRGCGTWVKA